MNNWFRINHKFLQSELWLKDKFTHGQAWIDLIGNANYKDTSFMLRGNKVEVKRGQIAWSLRFMSKRWGHTQKWVLNYLKYLKSVAQIEVQKVYPVSLITIINYEKYQSKNDKSDAQSGAQNAAQNAAITKNIKKEKKVVVKKPDTLSEDLLVEIARRYNVSFESVKELNTDMELWFEENPSKAKGRVPKATLERWLRERISSGKLLPEMTEEQELELIAKSLKLPIRKENA